MAKDITRGIFNIIGAHPTGERAEMDYYSTNPLAVEKLASVYDIPHTVWECAAGGGNLSHTLEKMGHTVISSDIVYRGCGSVLDFFEADSMPEGCHCILTNPPYSQSVEFIRHSLNLVPKDCGVVAMFLKTQFLETQKRYELIFKDHAPEYMFQFIKRISCYKNGVENKENPAMPFAWFVWDMAERRRRIDNNETTATRIGWI